MKLVKRLQKQQERRTYRVRNQVRISGRLRLSVYRSNRHIYAQIIDDSEGHTLVSANTMEASIAGPKKDAGNVEFAKKVGQLIGERAKEKGIVDVAFDRGSARYHGRIKALADAAREAGLNF